MFNRCSLKNVPPELTHEKIVVLPAKNRNEDFSTFLLNADKPLPKLPISNSFPDLQQKEQCEVIKNRMAFSNSDSLCTYPTKAQQGPSCND